MIDNAPEPVIVPHADLSPEALRGVIEAFVLREGTDYGLHEFSLEQKVTHVLQQLQRGEARIQFDPITSSVDIVVSLARRVAD
ncbi:MAG: YheU family protein [Povalibacter sp.]